MQGPRRIASDGDARRHIAGDDAARPDNGMIPDRDARQDDGATTDPDIAADGNGAAKFQHFLAQRRVAWVVGCQDLHARTDLRSIANPDRHHIKQGGAGTGFGPGPLEVNTVVAMQVRRVGESPSGFVEGVPFLDGLSNHRSAPVSVLSIIRIGPTLTVRPVS